MASAFNLFTVLLAWAGCIWLCREAALRHKIISDWRLRLALGTAAWGAILVGIVEFLSFFHALNTPGLVCAWCVTDALLVLVCLRLARQRPMAFSLSSAWQHLTQIRQALERLPLMAKCCWVAFVLIIAFIFGVALTTPPTNSDSLAYHLPRVMHWMQQQSVEHFPTDNPREIEFGPWAEFVILQAFLLEGTDRLANMPQFCAMVLTVLLLSLLVELIGKYSRLRWWSEETAESLAGRQNAAALGALLGLTVPMGLLQGMTPQNDYITAFWMVSLYVFVLALLLEPENLFYAAGAGLALGLGLLTKSTTFFYAGPLLAAFAGWLLFRRAGLQQKFRTAGLIASMVLLLNVSHAMRNYNVFGSPLGSDRIKLLVVNERIAPTTFASNLIRNLALEHNCGIPWVTKGLNRLAATLHSLTGESMYDPTTTFPPWRNDFIDEFLLYDDYASAPLHLLAVLIGLAILLRRPRRNVRLLAYAGCVLAGFLLFVLLLKFQFYHSRFHLGFFLLLSPLLGLVLMQSLPRWSTVLVTGSLVGYACFCLYANQTRPVFNKAFLSMPRDWQYLIHSKPWNGALHGIAEDLTQARCQRIGLKLGFESYEYPLWLLLKQRGFAGHIDHAFVNDISARLDPNPTAPTVIVTKLCNPPPEVTERYPYRILYPPLMVLWAEKPPHFPVQQVPNHP